MSCVGTRWIASALATSGMLALILLLAPDAGADVIVVEPRGGDGAALLQAAIDSALDADVLLLKPGDYVGAGLPALTISGKSLTLMADAGPGRLDVRAANVDNLPAGGLVLRGLRFAGPQVDPGGSPLHTGATLDIKGNGPESVLWLEDCEVIGAADVSFTGGTGFISGSGPTGLHLRHDPGGGVALVAVRSTIRGAQGGEDVELLLGTGGNAVGIHIADASFFECSLLGGDGSDSAVPFLLAPAHGGDGLTVGDGLVFASGTTLLGGATGDNSVQAVVSGAGLRLVLASSHAWLRGCTVEAGLNLAPFGTQSADIIAPAGHVETYPAAPRSVSVPALLREVTTTTVTVNGVSGDLVGVLVSTNSRWQAPIPGLQGTPIVDLGAAADLLVGVITAADGSLEVPLTVPRLPAGVEVIRLFAQGVFVGADGTTLGSGSAFCWISASF